MDADEARPAERIQLQLRILFAGGERIGPGKIDLLEAIGRTGSISAAGRELAMSYRRAWLLVDALNGLFTKPSVQASTGGAHGGGAVVTEFGRDLIAAYRRIEAGARAMIDSELEPFEAFIANSPGPAAGGGEQGSREAADRPPGITGRPAPQS